MKEHHGPLPSLHYKLQHQRHMFLNVWWVSALAEEDRRMDFKHVLQFRLYFILAHFHNNHIVFWVTVKGLEIHLIQKPELVSVKTQDPFVFWIVSMRKQEQFVIDLSQGSSIFNFWQEWKQWGSWLLWGLEGYSVFNGLHGSLIAYRLVNWRNIFFKRLSVDKNSTKQSKFKNYMRSMTLIQHTQL